MHIHNGLAAAKNENKVMKFAGNWMNWEKLYLSEAIQAQKAILCSLPYVETTFEVLGLWDLILNIHGSQKTRKGLLGVPRVFLSEEDSKCCEGGKGNNGEMV